MRARAGVQQTSSATGPQLCGWGPPLSCRVARRIYWLHPSTACKAAASGRSAEWGRLSASNEPPLDSASSRPVLLDDATLVQASAELQELCRQQLQLLTSALQLSLQATLSSNASIDDALGEEALRQQLLLDGGCLQSTVYCRAPASLQTGQLQLQQVAACGGSEAQQQRQQRQQQQRFLFLGQEGVGGTSLADQEQWILEQPVIVLPDSGGLVLPLAHNSFLVGLLVVERCIEEQVQHEVAGPVAAEGAEEQQSSGSRSGGSAAMPQPPACLLFGSKELQLLKQAGAVLALACAMDLRAALERVGAAYRQRQASALVQAAKKPLSVMRTLGTMLLPRLQPGEPDRDFAQGILEQGSRLQEVVSQLQAALHPSAAAAVVPPALLLPGALGSQPMRKALPQGTSSIGSSSISSNESDAAQWQLARPALPSSSIGSDYQWGSTIEASVDEPPAAQTLESSMSGSSSSSSLSGSGITAGGSNNSSMPVYGSRASADLLNVLMPLLASAGNFAAVNGVSFVMAEEVGSTAGGSEARGAGGGSATATAVRQQVVLPAAEVAVGPGKLKRMLSQLIDGIIACAARGDVVQASAVLQQRQGRPGVAISLCCHYCLMHSSKPAGRAGEVVLPRPPMQPEFAFLQGSAADVGGFFEVQSDATPDVQLLNSSALTATLWLPTVAHDAGWS